MDNIDSSFLYGFYLIALTVREQNDAKLGARILKLAGLLPHRNVEAVRHILDLPPLIVHNA